MDAYITYFKKNENLYQKYYKACNNDFCLRFDYIEKSRSKAKTRKNCFKIYPLYLNILY